MAVLRILAGAALVWLTALGLGAWVMRPVEKRLPRFEAWLYRALVGSALTSTAVFVLCFAQLASLPWFLGLAAVSAGLLWVCGAPSGERFRAIDWRWSATFWTLYAVYSISYLPDALAPETMPDAASYHLGEVRRYLAAHGFSVPVTDLYLAFPQGMEMLFLPAYAVGQHSAAKLVHWGFLELLPLLMYAYGRRTGQLAAGTLGGLFVLFSPLAGQIGTSAYVDVALAAAAFGTFALIEQWDDDLWLRPVGLLAGFTVGLKVTALLACAVVLAAVIWRRRWLPVLTVLTGMFLTGGLWLSRDWAQFGNPLAPFANVWFPNSYFTEDMEASLREGLSHKKEPGVAATAADVLWIGERFGGAVGPMYALLPLALLAWRRALLWRLLGWSLVFGIAYAGNTGARFLVPALPFWGCAIGLGASVVPRAALGLAIVAAYLCWPGVWSRNWRPVERPWKAALRRIDEQTYLRERCIECRQAWLLEANTPQNAQVFSIGPVFNAYHSRLVYPNWMSAMAMRADELIKLPIEWGLQPRRLVRFSFERQALKAIRLVQTAPAGPDPYSVSELELRDGNTAVGLMQASASHMNTEAHLAIDGSDLTRWRVHRHALPGMWLAAMVRGGHEADQLIARLSLDQGLIRVRLEGQDLNDAWHPLGEKHEAQELPTPPNLRPRAAKELRQMGFTHFLLREDNYYSDDYRKRAAEWGLQLVAEGEGAYLYRLQ